LTKASDKLARERAFTTAMTTEFAETLDGRIGMLLENKDAWISKPGG
jgi:hypothetical protein